MATKARQQYFADETSLQKERREFSIADNIQQKIDSIETGAQVNTIEVVKVNGTALTPDANKAVNVEIPDVIDNLYTSDSNNALSAKQGKTLYEYIQSVGSRGRFLSNWNCATGLPVTNPQEDPYPYKAGDYYSVSNVATSPAVNFRPDGNQYSRGHASSVQENETVSVSDFYLYDGTNWLLLINTARQIAIDSSLSTTSTNPVQNRVITNEVNKKIESSNNTYNNIIHLSQSDYDNLVTKDPNTFYSTPDDGEDIRDDLNTKTFYLTGDTGQTNIDTAQDAYDWYSVGKNPIISYNNSAYVLMNATSSKLTFKGGLAQQNQNSSSFIAQDIIELNIVSDLVDSITLDISVVGGSYLRLGQNYSTPYTPTEDGEPTSKKYTDEHGPNIPVYYYSGDFNSNITFNMIEAGEYRLYVRAYHGTTVDKTLTLTVDGVTVGTLTSNLIENLNASINFTASAGSTVVLTVSSKTNFTIQEVYIEKINIQSGYLTATVN